MEIGENRTADILLKYQCKSENELIENLSSSPLELVKLFNFMTNKENHLHINNAQFSEKVLKKIQKIDKNNNLISENDLLNETINKIYFEINDSSLRYSCMKFNCNHLTNKTIYTALYHAEYEGAKKYIEICIRLIEEKTGVTIDANKIPISININSPKIPFDKLSEEITFLSNVYKDLYKSHKSFSEFSITLTLDKENCDALLDNKSNFLQRHGALVKSLDFTSPTLKINLDNSYTNEFIEKIIKSCPNLEQLKIDTQILHGEQLQKFINKEKKAASILQSYIRSKRAQDRAVLPSEIMKAFKTIPFLAKLDPSVQKSFSMLLARELQNLLEDSNQYGVEVHYDKKTIHQFEFGKKGKSPFTFYIKVDPDTEMAVISINQKKSDKSKLGEGTFKIVHADVDLKMPLKKDANGRLILQSKGAIARPKEPIAFQINVVEPNQIHQQIHDQMKSQKLPGRVTDPPRIREHTSKKMGIKQELKQTFYPSDMDKLQETGTYPSEKAGKPIPVHFAARLRLIEEVLQTADSMSRLGITHRDIKPPNVLLKEEDGVIHAYLHDFDIISSEPVGYSSDYPIWDVGGQIGLVSHAADIVGSIFTAQSILFDQGSTNHANYKNGADYAFDQIVREWMNNKLAENSLPAIDPSRSPRKCLALIDQLSKSANTLENQQEIRQIKLEVEAGYTLMQLFCKYFEKEDAWKNRMLGSCIAYCAGVSADEYPNLTKTKYLERIDQYVESKLRDNFSHIIDQLSSSYKDKSLLELISISPDPLINYMTTGEVAKYNKILDEYRVLRKLRASFKQGLPAEGDPELFRLLNSKDPEERAKGREMGYQFFGRASNLQQQIHKISQKFTR